MPRSRSLFVTPSEARGLLLRDASLSLGKTGWRMRCFASLSMTEWRMSPQAEARGPSALACLGKTKRNACLGKIKRKACLGKTKRKQRS